MTNLLNNLEEILKTEQKGFTFIGHGDAEEI